MIFHCAFWLWARGSWTVSRGERGNLSDMQEGRGWNEDGLPGPTTDAEDGVARRFSGKRLQRGVGDGIKEWPGNGHFRDVLFQDRRGLF